MALTAPEYLLNLNTGKEQKFITFDAPSYEEALEKVEKLVEEAQKEADKAPGRPHVVEGILYNFLEEFDGEILRQKAPGPVRAPRIPLWDSFA